MVSDRIRDSRTIPELFINRVEESADRVAYEYEQGAQWHPVTWREYGEQVRWAALGLKSLGFDFGQRMAVWGDTMAEWTILDLATMALGGSTAGVYQTCTPDQAAYLINDSAATVVAVDHAGRLEQALAVRGQTPGVRCYVTWGSGADPDNDIYAFEDLVEFGKRYDEQHPGAYEESVRQVTPDTTAVLVYTSGTTGPPKGAMLSHRNCLFCCRAVHERLALDNATNVSFLPLSHVAEHVVGFFNRIYSGGTAFFLPDMTRFAEVAQLKAPTILGAVPRLYEKMHAAVMEKVEAASPTRRALFNWALKTGGEVARFRADRLPVPPAKAAMHRVADRMVLSKIRGVLGGQVQFMVCGAAPIAKEIVEFWNAVGIPFFEVYGMTECSGISHVNYHGKQRPGTVGTLVPGFEFALAEDGEILLRGEGVFQGYLNKPDATRATIDEDGWLHTGDVGEIDEDGFLRITDRKKNLIVTAGGKNVAPANIELLIARDPIVSQVVVIGDKRRFLSALITLSTEELENLRQTEPFSSMAIPEIIASDAIQQRVQRAVDRANAELARYENIRKYKVLDREFSIEDGEMTPTLKLKRRAIEERFGDVIEAFYEEGVAEHV